MPLTAVPDVLGNGGDGHVHDRRVQRYKELRRCQRQEADRSTLGVITSRLGHRRILVQSRAPGRDGRIRTGVLLLPKQAR